VLIISVAIRLAVPRADWHSVTFSALWARFLGLAILLAATALTLWARFALGLMWSAAPAVKEGHHWPPRAHRPPGHGRLRRLHLDRAGGRGLGPHPPAHCLPATRHACEDVLIAGTG
jgi:hypothetical protein